MMQILLFMCCDFFSVNYYTKIKKYEKYNVFQRYRFIENSYSILEIKTHFI